MHVRREMAAQQLELARKVLGKWERALKRPEPWRQTDGIGNVVSEKPVPKGASVVQTLGEDDDLKMRAELAAVATALEGLAST